MTSGEIKAIRAQLDRKIGYGAKWGVSIDDAKTLCNALDSITAERDALRRQLASLEEDSRQWKAACAVVGRDTIDGRALDDITDLTSERDSLQQQITEARAALEEIAHGSRNYRLAVVHDIARAALAHIGSFHGDEDCTSQLAAVARAALAKIGER